MRTAILFLTAVTAAHGEILRLSKVVESPAPGVTRFEFGDEKKQIVFVEDTPIVTEKDVEVALPSPSRTDAIDITLTEAGGEKMAAATAGLRPTVARIAIVLNGAVESAPVLQSVPLGKNFVINGLDAEDERETLAGLISGKSAEEIQAEYEKAGRIQAYYENARKGPSNLVFAHPDPSLISPANPIKWMEATRLTLKEGRIDLTDQDTHLLIAMLWQVSHIHDAARFRKDCDPMTFLARETPEVSKLVSDSENGSVAATDLRKVLAPYVIDSKKLP